MKVQSATLTNTTPHTLTVGANLMLCLPVEFSMEALQKLDPDALQQVLVQSIKGMVAAIPEADLARQVLDFSIEGADSHGQGQVYATQYSPTGIAIRNV